MRSSWGAAVGAIGLALATACSGGGKPVSTTTTAPAPPQTVVPLAGASTMAALPGTGFLAGERATGRVREVTPAGSVRPDPVVTVAVSNAGGQGLLGLAVDGGGRVFAAWTAPPGSAPEAGRLLVGQVFPEPVRIVWMGPPAGTKDLGGHLVLASDNRLVLGVGDLGDLARVADPVAANGKIISLDPEGTPAQSPVVISSGWRDPAGFAFTPDGHLWVLDRTGPGAGRLARGDAGGRPSDVSALTGSAVGGVVATAADSLVVCTGAGDGRLERRLVGPKGRATAPRPNRPVAAGCVLGLTRLSDGRVAAAASAAVHLVAIP